MFHSHLKCYMYVHLQDEAKPLPYQFKYIYICIYICKHVYLIQSYSPIIEETIIFAFTLIFEEILRTKSLILANPH